MTVVVSIIGKKATRESSLRCPAQVIMQVVTGRSICGCGDRCDGELVYNMHEDEAQKRPTPWTVFRSLGCVRDYTLLCTPSRRVVRFCRENVARIDPIVGVSCGMQVSERKGTQEIRRLPKALPSQRRAARTVEWRIKRRARILCAKDSRSF